MNGVSLRNIFLALSLSTSEAAFANYYNCNRYEGQTGRVTEVTVGSDESTSTFISFAMEINGTSTGQISVKSILDDNSGKGMFQLLLTAFVTQEKFRIDRCYANQLAGGHIISKW